MRRSIDFYTSIEDLLDINIGLLKQEIKDEEIKGNVVLIGENENGILTIFFETKDGISFYNWAAPTGFSRGYNANTLEEAESKAECMGMYFTPTGLLKAKPAQYGQQKIDKKKLGIDWKVGE